MEQKREVPSAFSSIFLLSQHILDVYKGVGISFQKDTDLSVSAAHVWNRNTLEIMGNDLEESAAQSEVNCTFKNSKSVHTEGCISHGKSPGL